MGLVISYYYREVIESIGNGSQESWHSFPVLDTNSAFIVLVISVYM